MAVYGEFHPLRLLWSLVPAFSVLVGILLTQLPFGANGLIVTPAFPLIPVFFWATYRPQLLPIPVVFVFGLVQDLLSSGPLGLWAIVFLITYAITLWQSEQIANQRFRIQWLGFAAACSVGLVAGWFFASVYASQFLGPLPIVVQAGTTVILFSIVAWFFLFLERRIAAHQR